jgi:hypothetical protein
MTLKQTRLTAGNQIALGSFSSVLLLLSWNRLSFLLYPLGLAIGVLGKLSDGEPGLAQ